MCTQKPLRVERSLRSHSSEPQIPGPAIGIGQSSAFSFHNTKDLPFEENVRSQTHRKARLGPATSFKEAARRSTLRGITELIHSHLPSGCGHPAALPPGTEPGALAQNQEPEIKGMVHDPRGYLAYAEVSPKSCVQ